MKEGVEREGLHTPISDSHSVSERQSMEQTAPGRDRDGTRHMRTRHSSLLTVAMETPSLPLIQKEVHTNIHFRYPAHHRRHRRNRHAQDR